MVVKGEKISRNIGYRTANIELQDTSIEDGVYKVNILYDGRVYHGV
ncbi:MAG: hypothetical protein H6767_09250 [Candidatus Peribacteria bacterium]|nr:MAG: hypothetical protein H6767_09250 [Candidatus Peribacteria bacterium]